MPKRRQRRHGDLPAGFVWREGRPRWVPSPARRKQGWRATDLKDAWGKWLPRGAAIEKAQAIADAVDRWVAGHAVPSAMVAIAPKGADLAGALGAALNPRSIGVLLDAYYNGGLLRLADKTQADYKSKLKRFLETVAGSADEDKVERVKAMDIDILLPPGFNEPGDFELERAYETLRDSAGESMAFGVLACVSAWLGWCVKKKRIWPTNPAKLVERSVPDGRLVVFEWPELVALVRQAEAVGLPSIADAIILAVDLSWSEQDILALTRGQENLGPDGKVRMKHRRIKTGVAGNPPLLKIGRDRLNVIKARWAHETVQPTSLIVCELTGNPWSDDTFRHKFAEIRAAVAAGDPANGRAPMPSIASRQFRDLRDTAVTYAYEAGLNLQEICSRTLHAPDRAQQVITKHYGSIRQSIADEAGAKLDAHFERMGYDFEPLLALPAPAQTEGQ